MTKISNKVVEMSLTLDEARMIRFFRCLSDEAKSSCYFKIASSAFYELFPDETVDAVLYSGMEHFAEDDSNLDSTDYRDPNTVGYIISSGLEEANISETVFSMSVWDEEYSIPAFVFRSKIEAENNGNYYLDHEKLARTYIRGSRDKILSACEKAKENNLEDNK